MITEEEKEQAMELYLEMKRAAGVPEGKEFLCYDKDLDMLRGCSRGEYELGGENG